MKKLSLFLFLSATILFTSCEKDSDENQLKNSLTSESDIIGEWDLTAYKVEDGETVTKVNGASVTQKYSSIGKDFDMQIEFSNDPNTATSNGSFISETSISILGQTQVTEIPLYTVFNSSTWELRDGVIFFIDENNKETKMTTIESTENKLVLSYDINETIEVQEGATSTTTGKLTITMER
ncbi:hypothetical protein [uncultured Maribacter sp.]|uniref:hypothetical protein n=1 Tax=uncultured Maribacter sp. TaxID=431308 RepID=UPI00260CC3FE|nr:hypothetical protein [uncultured Maribacter sp.]